MRETVEGKNRFLYFQCHFCPAFWTRDPACSFCARSKSKNYVTGPEWNTHTQTHTHTHTHTQICKCDLLTNSCPVCQYIYTVNICRFGNFSNIFNLKEMPVPSSHQFSSIPWSHSSTPRVTFSLPLAGSETVSITPGVASPSCFTEVASQLLCVDLAQKRWESWRLTSTSKKKKKKVSRWDRLINGLSKNRF